MEPLAQWREYAACWTTAPTERSDQLRNVVDEAIIYRDPGTGADGVAALDEYMTSFGRAFPGARFVIDDVVHHHDRSLALWRQVSADGTTAVHGASVAIHGDDGRFLDVTGFFPVS
jgi:hypothetical protein